MKQPFGWTGQWSIAKPELEPSEKFIALDVGKQQIINFARNLSISLGNGIRFEPIFIRIHAVFKKENQLLINDISDSGSLYFSSWLKNKLSRIRVLYFIVAKNI
ncbi:hypothetical protein QUF86_22930 [Peribacillus sp. NJ11]|uniref:hypothetical protein n=1 Tax=Peribacillus sp. NJ11 TaxID=3055861 RepID=UPI0025A1520C|nr:hypothetical protein [Peribacillus sp. NJ11]MDM5223533.1 hypothetical protein [Peribacillus sp. NJ11]